MLHGKKGFERIVWAAKNVLNRSLTWLFCDLQMAEGSSLGMSHQSSKMSNAYASEADTVSPLSKHHPSIFDFNPAERQQPHVRVPPLKPNDAADNYSTADVEEWSYDIIEWLGLVGLSSTRVQSNDNVDPLLCRWAFPEGTSENTTTIRVLRWQGMVDSGWITQLLFSCMYVS